MCGKTKYANHTYGKFAKLLICVTQTLWFNCHGKNVDLLSKLTKIYNQQTDDKEKQRETAKYS